MSQSFRVFAIDDDAYVREIIAGLVGQEATVETFASAEECRVRLAEAQPDMFLLDVRLPGTDGYAFCREIRERPELAQTPVTFVSALDTIEARLAGYEAGGEDFIVKPFAPEELLRKVQVARELVARKRALVSQLEDSELLSSMVMANMDEYAILMRFIRELLAFNDESEIAAGLLDMLGRYRVTGVVQLRISGRVRTISAQGEDLPLETSVMEHVRTLGRIFEFRGRGVHNFDRLTLMIKDLPVHDPDYCGRLRDHLCIAAECAESRLQAIEAEERVRRNQAGILHAIERIGASTENARANYLRDRAACAELVMMLEQDFSRICSHIELTAGDERAISDLIAGFSEKLLRLLDNGEETTLAMEDLGRLLKQLN